MRHSAGWYESGEFVIAHLRLGFQEPSWFLIIKEDKAFKVRSFEDAKLVAEQHVDHATVFGVRGIRFKK